MARKETTKPFILRLDAKTMEAVEKWADDEFRSTNGQLQWIITEALRKSRRLPKKTKEKKILIPNSMETIRNNQLCVTISEHGAELQSIKDAGGKEYLWQGDARFWGRRSPILFPIVGSLWNGRCTINGKTYEMGRHGFARDNDFKLIAKGETKAVFAFTDNAETLKRYPYKFNLAVSYRLEGNRIHVIWHVENTDEKAIYFQIGGHPAFNLPDLQPEEPIHGRLRFDVDNPIRRFATVKGCLDNARHETVKTENGIWNFTDKSFENDALIFDHSQLHHIELLNGAGETEVSVNFKAPAVGLWTPHGKNAPFICIEPWYGVADMEAYEGDIRDHYLMNQLLPGASFMAQYTITIG